MVLDGECLSYHRKLEITSQKICNEDMQFESVKNPHDFVDSYMEHEKPDCLINLSMVDMGSEGSFIFWDCDPVFKTSHQPLAYMDASLNAYGKMSLRGF